MVEVEEGLSMKGGRPQGPRRRPCGRPDERRRFPDELNARLSAGIRRVPPGLRYSELSGSCPSRRVSNFAV